MDGLQVGQSIEQLMLLITMTMMILYIDKYPEQCALPNTKTTYFSLFVNFYECLEIQLILHIWSLRGRRGCSIAQILQGGCYANANAGGQRAGKPIFGSHYNLFGSSFHNTTNFHLGSMSQRLFMEFHFSF